MSLQHSFKLRTWQTVLELCNEFLFSPPICVRPTRRAQFIIVQSAPAAGSTTQPRRVFRRRLMASLSTSRNWQNEGRIYFRGYATAMQQKDPGTSRTMAVLVTSPKPEGLDPEEDIELIPDNEASLLLTERAAEKLHSISTKENDPNLALRIAVESGGCHGYQYKMDLTTASQPDDYKFSHPKFTSTASILVDAVSLGLLKGSTVDFETELIGSSFRILDNPQAKGNGCGCGVSWEANF